MSELVFGCVKVGTTFGPEYVNNLYHMVCSNLSRPFRFVCVTDDSAGLHKDIHPEEPVQAAHGWWHLMEFFRDPPWASDCDIIYTGLDAVIKGPIDSVADRDTLTLMRDFNDLVGNPNPIFADTWADGLAFVPRGGLPWLWTDYVNSKVGRTPFPMHVWLTWKLREKRIMPALWQDIQPGLITSFKWPIPKLSEPDEPVVLFHGEPRPKEAVQVAPWIGQYWRNGTGQ